MRSWLQLKGKANGFTLGETMSFTLGETMSFTNSETLELQLKSKAPARNAQYQSQKLCCWLQLKGKASGFTLGETLGVNTARNTNGYALGETMSFTNSETLELQLKSKAQQLYSW